MTDSTATKLTPPAPNLVGLTDDFVWQCLEAESEGDGILFASLFGDAVRYCVDMAVWFVWDGHIWREDKTQVVFALVSSVVDCYGELKNSLSFEGDDEHKKGAAAKRARIDRRIKHLRKPAGRNACLEFAWKGRAIAVEASAFDADPYKLGVTNGTLDLKTGMLLAARPEDMITKQSRAAYIPWTDVPAEQREVVETFFRQIWDGDEEKTRFFQRMIGQALIGEVINHIFPFLLGRRARNGKTVLCAVLMHVFGGYGITFNSSLLCEQYANSNNAAYEIIKFDGARLAISSEVKEGAVFSADLIKRMTGGDPLIGRGLFQDFRTFQPRFLPLMLGNHEPTPPVGDNGFWDRALLFNFPMRFEYEPDPTKKELQRIDGYERVLLAAGDAFLSWFVEGALEYQADDCRLRPPESVRKDTTEYRDDADWIMQFRSACTQESAADTKSSDLYNVFVVWYREHINARNVPSQVRFGKKMRETGLWEAIRKADGVYFRGIALNEIWARRLADSEQGGMW